MGAHKAEIREICHGGEIIIVFLPDGDKILASCCLLHSPAKGYDADLLDWLLISQNIFDNQPTSGILKNGNYVAELFL